MTCPHEQLRGRCYHPSLAPWPGNCLDDDTCPGGFGPWGAWRAFVAQIRNFDNGYVYIAGPAWWSDEVWFMPQKTIAASGWMP